MRETDNIEVIIVQRDGEIHHASYRCWKATKRTPPGLSGGCTGILNEVTPKAILKEAVGTGPGTLKEEERGSQCGWGG